MIFSLIIISFIYLLTISLLIYGLDKIENYKLSGLKPKTKFSIIVPFRNEAENLPVLLKSLSNLNYPTQLFEVILVDDASETQYTLPDVEYSVKIINNIRVSKSPKKDAITTAINTIQNNWIITTDADCTVKTNWLLTLDNYIQEKNPEMIVSAVAYNSNTSFLHNFQQLDMASLQGATIGSFGVKKPFMCNGANFAYTKKTFQILNGFNGNDTLASGDDVFLLQKAIAQFPEKVMYLKSQENIVFTNPQESWKTLFFQRVRWASKTVSYKNNFAKQLALVIFFGNLFWILTLVFSILKKLNFETTFLVILLKCSIDAILIHKTNSFLKTKTHHLFLASIIYPFFSTSVAIYSLFGKYEWKGRIFKK